MDDAHQNGALLHLADRIVVEHVPRLVAQRHIDNDLHRLQRTKRSIAAVAA